MPGPAGGDGVLISDPVELQFCTSNGASIAYADFGGPGPPIVFHTETSVEAHLAAAFERPWLEMIRRLGRLILVDLRGCGASDGMEPGRPLPPERRVDDLVTVLDAIDAPAVTMVGVLHGAASLALFAARHPERVDRLVLFGPYVRMFHGSAEADELFDELVDSLTSEWGHGWHVPRHAPGRVGDEAFRRDWARVERMTATPSGMALLLRSFRLLDLGPVLPQITAPTLVLERRDFGVITESAERDVASRIPAATYVELDTDPEFAKFDDIRTEVERFLTGEAADEDRDRQLVVILVTDIVGSTETAGALGDRRWRQRLDAHDERSAEIVARFGGRHIKTTGDGLIAVFAGPSRAARAADELVRDLSSIGLEIRVGLHAGEVEARGDDIGGVAVHLAARVCAAAGPGEVLVSRTIPDLVAGSGLHFEERGDHALKGLPGTWRLHRLVPGPR